MSLIGFKVRNELVKAGNKRCFDRCIIGSEVRALLVDDNDLEHVVALAGGVEVEAEIEGLVFMHQGDHFIGVFVPDGFVFQNHIKECRTEHFVAVECQCFRYSTASFRIGSVHRHTDQTGAAEDLVLFLGFVKLGQGQYAEVEFDFPQVGVQPADVQFGEEGTAFDQDVPSRWDESSSCP